MNISELSTYQISFIHNKPLKEILPYNPNTHKFVVNNNIDIIVYDSNMNIVYFETKYAVEINYFNNLNILYKNTFNKTKNSTEKIILYNLYGKEIYVSDDNNTYIKKITENHNKSAFVSIKCDKFYKEIEANKKNSADVFYYKTVTETGIDKIIHIEFFLKDLTDSRIYEYDYHTMNLPKVTHKKYKYNKLGNSKLIIY